MRLLHKHSTNTKTEGRPVKRRFAQAGVAAVALSAVSLMTVAAPAHASVAPASTGRSDACTSWGCGSGTWTWGKTSLPDISMSVNDTACNDLGVGIQLNITYTTGARWAGPIHWSGYNCHEGYYPWYGLSYDGSTPIQSARVVIWQKSDSGAPTGYGGNFVDNPYT
jgi:hypothetical protein